MVKFVFLTTDILIFLLLSIIAVFALYARKKEHLKAPWRHLKSRNLSMAAVVVLVTYVFVGLMDSIHFQRLIGEDGEKAQYSQVLSLLDVVATPLRTHVEKTYSAPFAVRSYVKETITLEDGGQQRVYPRLKYGGAHLAKSGDRARDILKTGFSALLTALGLSAAGIFVLACLLRDKGGSLAHALRSIFSGKTETAWLAVVVTACIVTIVVTQCIFFSSEYHILGTDKVGQDVFYQTLKSIRTGLMIGTLTTLVMLPFAILLGIMAGYFKGWIDDVIQYMYTTLNSIPHVLLIAAAILALQVYIANNEDLFDTVRRADLRLLFLCIILGITSWTGLCRLLRGETMKVRELDYIQSAVALGVGHMTIITRHILPNVFHIVLISVVLDFSSLVLAEAVLSYVGVGVDPIMDSWGNMINRARLEMAREPLVWWSLTAAFVFMFTFVLAANLFADGVRDAFDPRLRK